MKKWAVFFFKFLRKYLQIYYHILISRQGYCKYITLRHLAFFLSLENKYNDEQVFILFYHHVHILNLTIARENVRNLCAYGLNF